MIAMTRGDVRAWVERIARVTDDDEAAHVLEDELRAWVLKAIASGRCDDPKGCCEEALRTETFKFARWCA
jgi:hypothetical protein